MKYSLPVALGTVLSSALLVSGAGAPIGTVKASGDFRLAGASVRGNGTLFSGDMVEADNLRANVLIAGGAELTLAPHSRGKVFSDKVVLESGSSEVHASSGYMIEAGTLRVFTPSGRAIVDFSKDSGEVLVAANEGLVDVHDARGMLLAQLRNGQTRAFQTRSNTQNNSGAAAALYTGVVRKTSNGEYLLTDNATGMTVELRGLASELERGVGKTTMVRGTVLANAKPANGASAVISVTSAVDATTAPAGTLTSRKKGGFGLGGWTVGTIAAGGAAGGVFGGLAVSDTFGGRGHDTSR